MQGWTGVGGRGVKVGLLLAGVAAMLACGGMMGEMQKDAKQAARASVIGACTGVAKDLPKGSEDKVCSCVADEIVNKMSPAKLADLAKNGPDMGMVESSLKRCAKRAR
jgi:hypothetical protein